MSDADDQQEITQEELEEMLEEAIDVIAMTLPEEAGDEYWKALRELVEARAREFAEEDGEAEDEEEA